MEFWHLSTRSISTFHVSQPNLCDTAVFSLINQQVSLQGLYGVSIQPWRHALDSISGVLPQCHWSTCRQYPFDAELTGFPFHLRVSQNSLSLTGHLHHYNLIYFAIFSSRSVVQCWRSIESITAKKCTQNLCNTCNTIIVCFFFVCQRQSKVNDIIGGVRNNNHVARAATLLALSAPCLQRC